MCTAARWRRYCSATRLWPRWRLSAFPTAAWGSRWACRVLCVLCVLCVVCMCALHACVCGCLHARACVGVYRVGDA